MLQVTEQTFAFYRGYLFLRHSFGG